jgi:hypothetical protein
MWQGESQREDPSGRGNRDARTGNRRVTARYKDEKGSKKTGAWKAKGRIKEMSQ